MPAVGGRVNTDGSFNVLPGSGGRYWASTSGSGSNGRNLSFSSTDSDPALSSNTAYGRSIRCVR